MTTATVRDLRNHFSKLAKKLARGEIVQITSRGKPIARLVPETKPQGFLGAAKGLATIPADFDEPLEIQWGSEDE